MRKEHGSKSRAMDQYSSKENEPTHWINCRDYAQPYHGRLLFSGNEPVDQLTGANFRYCARALGLNHWMTWDAHPLIFSNRAENLLAQVAGSSVGPFFQAVNGAMGIIEEKLYPPHLVEAIMHRKKIQGEHPHRLLFNHIVDAVQDFGGVVSEPTTFQHSDGRAGMVVGELITAGAASLVAHMTVHVVGSARANAAKREFVVKVPSPSTLLGFKSASAPDHIHPFSAQLLRCHAILKSKEYARYLHSGGVRLAEPLIATPHLSIEEYVQRNDGPTPDSPEFLARLKQFTDHLHLMVHLVELDHDSYDIRSLMRNFFRKVDMFDNRKTSDDGLDRMPDRLENIIVGRSTLDNESGVYCVDPFAWEALPISGYYPYNQAQPYFNPPWRKGPQKLFSPRNFILAFGERPPTRTVGVRRKRTK